MAVYANDEQKTPATGIVGTILGGTALALGTNILGGGNGLGLFGNSNNSLAVENAQLKAEKYSDNAAELARQQLLQNWLKPLADEAAANKVVIAQIQADVKSNKEICDLRMELAEQRQATAQAVTNGAIGSLMQQVGALQSLTRCVIPITNVCPQPMPLYNSFQVPSSGGSSSGGGTSTT